MKKILSILMAAALVFTLAALVACQDSTPITTETEPETTAPAETPLDSAITISCEKPEKQQLIHAIL